VINLAKARLRELDRDLPIFDAMPMTSAVSDSVAQPRFYAILLASFACIALLLATIGIYGVISYSVRQRTREIGVRLALGATVGDVHRMILREGVRLVGIGVVAGGAVSLGAAGSVGSMLFIRNPRDLLTFTLVPAMLAVVGVIACWIPAIRATNIDPAMALRDE
jgi:putative ABC transport system permease protein